MDQNGCQVWDLFHKSDGQIYVSTWLDHNPQVCGVYWERRNSLKVPWERGNSACRVYCQLLPQSLQLALPGGLPYTFHTCLTSLRNHVSQFILFISDTENICFMYRTYKHTNTWIQKYTKMETMRGNVWSWHRNKWKVKVKVAQSCPTLCNAMD